MLPFLAVGARAGALIPPEAMGRGWRALCGWFLRRGCHRAECSGRSGWPAARSPPARRQALHTAAVGVNGVELHCVRAGEAGPAVLCMPGALGTAMTDFEPRLAGLAGSHQVRRRRRPCQPAIACHSRP